jgi:hypothetical protein
MHGGLLSPSANFASPRNAPAWNVARPNCIVVGAPRKNSFPTTPVLLIHPQAGDTIIDGLSSSETDAVDFSPAPSGYGAFLPRLRAPDRTGANSARFSSSFP